MIRPLPLQLQTLLETFFTTRDVFIDRLLRDRVPGFPNIPTKFRFFFDVGPKVLERHCVNKSLHQLPQVFDHRKVRAPCWPLSPQQVQKFVRVQERKTLVGSVDFEAVLLKNVRRVLVLWVRTNVSHVHFHVRSILHQHLANEIPRPRMKPTIALWELYEKSEAFSNSTPKVRRRAVLRVHPWVRRSPWRDILCPTPVVIAVEPFLISYDHPLLYTQKVRHALQSLGWIVLPLSFRRQRPQHVCEPQFRQVAMNSGRMPLLIASKTSLHLLRDHYRGRKLALHTVSLSDRDARDHIN